MQRTEQSSTSPRLIPREQFRKALGGISRTTDYRLTQKGELPPAIKIGGQDFSMESDAGEVIAKRRAEADARQQERLNNCHVEAVSNG